MIHHLVEGMHGGFDVVNSFVRLAIEEALEANPEVLLLCQPVVRHCCLAMLPLVAVCPPWQVMHQAFNDNVESVRGLLRGGSTPDLVGAALGHSLSHLSDETALFGAQSKHRTGLQSSSM